VGAALVHAHADDVEAEARGFRIFRPTLAPQALRSADQFVAFLFVDACERAFEGGEAAHAHFDDRDEIVLLNEQINLVAPHTKVALQNDEAERGEVFLGGTLGLVTCDLFFGGQRIAGGAQSCE